MLTNQTILVVEDDPKIRKLLRTVMETEGFAVLESDTSSKTREVIASRPVSLVTLDIHLGSDNGLDLAREIRRTSDVPIIMVTGQDDVIDRVVGLEIGADDYITKPFHLREVVARIKSVLRRTTEDTAANANVAQSPVSTGESTSFTFDGLTAIPDRMELIDRDGEDCGLTSGDFKLLSVFLNRPKRVLSRDQLMDLVGGAEWNPLDRTIDNQVALEINARSGLPHDRFIRMAKDMGAKFSFGTNNFDDKPIDMSRFMEAIDRYNLSKDDMYVPSGQGLDREL